MVEIDTILEIIITVVTVGIAFWGIIQYFNRQKKEKEEYDAEMELEHDELLLKKIKMEFENSLEIVRKEIAELRITATKQLRRQSKRSDFTNSNVRKVRNDLLDLQEEQHMIKQGLVTKGIELPKQNEYSQFKREMQRKREEIARDEREQTPDDDDE